MKVVELLPPAVQTELVSGISFSSALIYCFPVESLVVPRFISK